MSHGGVKLLCAIGAAASLLYIYLEFALAFLQKVDPTGLSSVEQLIVVTQVARLVAVFAVPRLRNANAEVVWIFFSLETFAVVGLMGVFVYTSDPFYSRLVVDIFSTWITALLLLTPPYTIFRFAAGMARRAKLWRIFFSVILEFGFLVFLNDIISQVKGPVNFGNFLTSVILSVKGAVVGGKSPVSVGSGVIDTAIILYVALLVYAGVPSDNEKSYLASILAPALLATLVLFGWISFAATLVANTLISLTAPTIALTLLIWWWTREK